MLEIKNVNKQYKTGSFIQTALHDVSLNFRDNEFVSILGPSGSGKTTLLNIIGGLDKYDSGDIVINHVSTKNYKDRDWDSYRSHSIGFIFQSYNLIPHQTLLKNVELALTISNVPSSQRKQRAIDALEKVGLKDHINKKPNQLSGGQMQRVAIARALVNNPKIILADEPTGALDSKTSVQVMELLKEVAEDRLVVMVTHNPELAREYSSRIVELKDGILCSDSNPFIIEKGQEVAIENRSFGKVGMSLGTSMKLSFNNLLSKFKRTALVAIAGSIGIIGISLIMSLSNGANSYIQSMEEQTLSEYPLTISKSTMDLTSLMGVADSIAGGENDNKIHEQQVISGLFGTVQENDLKSFKEHIESGETQIKDYVNAIEYNYNLVPYIYHVDENGKTRQVSPDNVIESSGLTTIASLMAGQTTTFAALPADESLYKTKYDIVEGKWPENTNELVIILGPGNTISDLALYNMGLKDTEKLDAMIESYSNGLSENKLDVGDPQSWDFVDVMNKEFYLINACDMYSYDEKVGCWVKINEDTEIQSLVKTGEKLTVVGVARPNEENTTPTMTPAIYYTSELVYDMINNASKSKIVKEQLENHEINIFTGKRFDDNANEFDMSTMFDFDESAFEDVFAFDSNSVDMDLSGFDSINVGSFNISNYIDASSMKELMSNMTEDAIKKLFKGVTVDITREKLNELFKALYADFLESTNNDPSMNIDNIGQSINQYLQTDGAKDIVQETIAGSMENGKDAILSSYDFTSLVAQFLREYVTYTQAQELEPTDYVSMDLFMETTEAQQLINSMANAAADAITNMLLSSNVSTNLINNLTEGYNAYAEENNLPIASKIAEAFLKYLSSEHAFNIIMSHAEEMIDMEMLRSNLDNIATDVGTQISAVIGAQLSSAMKHLASQLSVQIESAITTAMTDYMSQMMSSFDFSTDSLMEVIDVNMSAEKMKDILTNMLSGQTQTAKTNLQSIGYADVNDPDSITFYPIDFENKANVVSILDTYNKDMKESEQDEKVISYSDMVGSLMSSVTSIIDIIGYVLIAFVSISLVVSSIMIGVITYISVLERKKEIGILRAMGASKKNITQVFNCETIITGFLAGAIGVVATWLILIPANAIVQYALNQPALRGFLPVDSALFLIALSMVLTTIGGLMPSKSAAKQDPVIALRSE